MRRGIRKLGTRARPRERRGFPRGSPAPPRVHTTCWPVALAPLIGFLPVATDCSASFFTTAAPRQLVRAEVTARRTRANATERFSARFTVGHPPCTNAPCRSARRAVVTAHAADGGR